MTDQRLKNWQEIQQAVHDLLEEISMLAMHPTEEQLHCMSDAYKTLHCHALRFIQDQEKGGE